MHLQKTCRFWKGSMCPVAILALIDSECIEMNRIKCQDCEHLCCNYITVKIPAPRTILDFDGLLWQLSHENIKAFRDHTGWHLMIYNKCSHLKNNGECAIYDDRPITCREHSVENCEYNDLYRNHHCSILEVFNRSMITAIKDLKLGENDFEGKLTFFK